ncbi:MAG: Maf family nucleotide pyrophosphatase [Bacteroidota bacterium]
MQLFEELKKYDLILGSQSPRRKALMESAGFTFRTWVIPTAEKFPPQLAPEEIALFLCRQKAEPFKAHLNPDSIVITADTIVVLNRDILNKAATPQEAFIMLSRLNNREHRVITGVAITSAKAQKSFTETTRVFFHKLSDEEIRGYIDQYKPFDKAGAYGIQEWIGMAGVKKIDGCYYNVVGLPTSRLYHEMKIFLGEQF